MQKHPLAQWIALLTAGATFMGAGVATYQSLFPAPVSSERDACLDALKVMAENFAKR